MTIQLDAADLDAVLTLTPASQNIMLVGKHGIGKSEIITESYTRRGMRVVPFFLGQMSDPGDLIGLMHKDEATGRSLFLPPYWWPRPDEPIVLFLDELNRARPEILQAVQDLTLNRTLAGRALPPGSAVVSAVNEGEEYQLTDLDPALVSRFNVYRFVPTVEDWLQWATRRGLDPRVVRFIQKHPEHLEGAPIEAWGNGIDKTPDRRAWARVAALLDTLPQVDKLHVKMIAGIVGVPAAVALERSLAESSGLSPDDVLLQFKRHEKRLRELPLADTILLGEQIVQHLDAGRCADEARARQNLLAWLKLLKATQRQEAIAHFAALLEAPRYQRAMAVVAPSMDLMTLLIDYIQGIKV